MVESFVTLFVLAVLCEAVVEWVKDLVPAIAGTGAKIAALVVGLVLTFGAGQNLFSLIGVQFTYPIVGTILAGIIVSRGSNYIHDLIAKLQDEEVA